ncbi:tRNA pseudouridine(13) synthase TruD [Halapricum hydrolyticum]|uniref:Probable tRNA pseudouridine synthase D n=1 Tax=Halapricum hydrolyticum TaxID=2979991 RepID=A0AAE3ICR7_9EURY|nr:tRNA pseudouridine(13) synthase TruD [Halapricum hydrolyticum]MCU4718750.1 tRNA pseudouridine(13) synthase TruD [Halapricum hydrolyticum]MCU4727737.1 tRNA pseudouridine(13) synthase TruD [Halapricum hydrolyticum]
MREAHPLEATVGIDYYVSDAAGIGGRLRDSPESFRVEEIEAFDAEPIDAAPGAYPHVLVRATLRGWDTNDFASVLSDQLGISRERIDWAGTKDKHAVTTQLFTVRKGDPDAIAAVDLSGADIEVLGRTGRGLQFGDLAGNRFEITVTGAEQTETIGQITDELGSFCGDDDRVGVPNFFGQQRFGSRRAITHEVGLAIVRREWEQAVRTYAANPSGRERQRTRDARSTVEDCWNDREWERTLDAMPGYLGYERAMLQRLAERKGETPADFRDALTALPSNLQRLFVNAAQSYVFNRICSERLRRGLPFDEPIEGDVICFADSDAPEGLDLPDTNRTQVVTERRVGTARRHVERGRAFVTAPLVGTDTEFGGGEPAEIARDVLADLDLEPADFDLPGEFESSGTRRAILVRTDLDVSVDSPTFSFALPKGSYATVLLREYLKAAPDDLA